MNELAVRVRCIGIAHRMLLVACIFGGACAAKRDRVAERREQALAARHVVDAGATPPFAEVIHQPASLTSISTGMVDPQGVEIGIACATCHRIREGRHPLPERADRLGGPHAGMTFAHGHLPCGSCHDPEDGTRLHLADRTPLAMTDALLLCKQCHGPQGRDYEHRAHGGMRGSWDLSRGVVYRNHCVDCHDPHAPRFGTFRPAPGARDRFLEPALGDDHRE